MSVEYLMIRVFSREIGGSGEIWVARSVHSTIYAMELDRAGFSLPIWSSRARVVAFLRNAKLTGPIYEPHAVPLKMFNSSWLADKGKAIIELQLNPEGSSARVLVMSPAEFLSLQGQE